MKKVKVTDTDGNSYINQMYVYVGQILWLSDCGYYYYENDQSTGLKLPRIVTEDVPSDIGRPLGTEQDA